MVPADADDIKKEYEILLGELVKYNPDLQDKSRVLAITKSDMLDEELIEALSEDLPEGVPVCLYLLRLPGNGDHGAERLAVEGTEQGNVPSR